VADDNELILLDVGGHIAAQVTRRAVGALPRHLAASEDRR
jgi:hypothetical protein